MVTYCCVPLCKSKGKQEGLSYHVIPFKRDPKLASKWVRYIRRDSKKSETISETMTVCSRHFLDSDFVRDKKKRVLKDDACPTQFDFNKNNIPAHCKKNFTVQVFCVFFLIIVTPAILLNKMYSHIMLL